MSHWPYDEYGSIYFSGMGSSRGKGKRTTKKSPKNYDSVRRLSPAKKVGSGKPPHGAKVWLVRSSRGLPGGLVGVVPKESSYRTLAAELGAEGTDCVVYFRDVPYLVPRRKLRLG